MRNTYLEKYAFCLPQLTTIPNKKTELIVVIPCFNEPYLIRSLNALYQCVITDFFVEIIIVINASEQASEEVIKQNKITEKEAKEWISKHSNKNISFQLIVNNTLPKKHAGVGLARKIGMDEAVFRFHQLEKEGVIAMFDADSTCATNYLQAIVQHFKKNPKTTGCSIYFEHPIAGNEFDATIYNGIINYELHLRYYVEGLRSAKLPYAFHTVGSSMAVRSSAYQKQGGMNKRKAGEDFYFIQKIIELGNYSELTTTKVIPSPRISDRVPFGTGKAIADWVKAGKSHFFTYNPQIFIDLAIFVAKIPQLYEKEVTVLEELPASIQSYLLANNISAVLEEVKANSSGAVSFEKRFYKWFNAFRVLKYIHHARDNFYANVTIEIAANQLNGSEKKSVEELLKSYRSFDVTNCIYRVNGAQMNKV